MDESSTNRSLVEQHRRIWDVAGSRAHTSPITLDAVRDDWQALRRQMHTPRSLPDRPAFAGRSSRDRSRTRGVIVATAAVLVLAGGWLAAQFFEEESQAFVEMREVATRPGQRARVPLGDGTFVRLNVASKIRFPDAFTNGKREVYLEGEAFFEVTEDSARPFVVNAADAVVQVLGTAFNVRAYEGEERVDVLVSRGKVALQSLESTDAEGVVLTAEQLGRLVGRRADRLESKADVHRHLAWMEGRLVFDDTRLGDVAAELERWYTVDVRIQDAMISDWRLTASFRNESIDEILSVIAASAGVQYTRDRETVTFSNRSIGMPSSAPDDEQ
jgi:ferric-dicitrate binding protein FerR (iron transport regulator)